ncbi:MAG: methyltransferase domain-containing protein [Verrucomicrobia bacterium]|nr:methyltransferase domain-containing protein [Verrucomicrobiota bacterium]MDA1087152.1 methyltransferase domain-containing protein [Verrucomicrobiota bacterium]
MSSTNEDTRDHFNRVSGAFQKRAWVAADDKVASFRNAVATRIQISPDSRVLEVGIGAGSFARIIAVNPANYYGIDISSDMLKHAAEVVPAENLHLGDGENLAMFADDDFDFVCCRNVVKHVSDPPQFVAEMARVCRPDGTVMLIESCAFDAEDCRFFEKVTAITEPSQKPYMLAEEYAPLMQGTGLTDIQTHPFGFIDHSNDAYLSTFHLSDSQKQAVWDLYAEAPESVRGRRQLAPLADEPGFQIWLRWVTVDGRKKA